MFNESQQRYLVSRLRSIDEMLSEASERLEPAGGRAFATIKPDATPAQRKVLGDYLAQLRFALKRFMLAQQLRDERTPTSGLWSFRTSIEFALIAVEELRPKYWRGYGDVDAESAAAAERFAAELTTLLRRIEGYLVRGEGGGLAARLAELGAAREELKLLRELERIIFSHGLTELRASLEVLVERAASSRFEIAVLGRVSAGKSSLLNWWLGRALLPTGVTPVTAVPTRIVHGDTARARIKTATAAGSSLEVPLEQLDAYVTERGNPGNAKRVLELLVETPAERLRGGICLVDTPGLGSLATSGAAQTLEYLPRCDLGILLVEAGAPVSQEDVDVARAVLDGGSDLLLVVSKADQLSSADLQQALAYVREQFQSRLAIPLSPQPVSCIGAQTRLAAEWFERELAPRLADHHEQASRILRRKIAALRESVIAVLAARLAPKGGKGSGSARGEASSGPGMIERGADITDPAARRERIGQVRSDLERARFQLRDLRMRLTEFAASVAGAAASELARCWLGAARGEEIIAERVARAVARRADEAGHAVARMLTELREELAEALERSGSGSESAEELPRPRGRPMFDSAAIPRLSRYERPGWLPRLSFAAGALARARIRRTMLAALEGRLAAYGEALCHWGMRYLEELEPRFDAAVALCESTERFASDPSLAAEAGSDARRDLELLENWPSDAASRAARPEPLASAGGAASSC